MNEHSYFAQFGGVEFEEIYKLPTGDDRTKMLRYYAASLSKAFITYQVQNDAYQVEKNLWPEIKALPEDKYYAMLRRLFRETWDSATEDERQAALREWENAEKYR